jgi:hypothetical protein
LNERPSNEGIHVVPLRPFWYFWYVFAGRDAVDDGLADVEGHLLVTVVEAALVLDEALVALRADVLVRPLRRHLAFEAVLDEVGDEQLGGLEGVHRPQIAAGLEGWGFRVTLPVVALVRPLVLLAAFRVRLLGFPPRGAELGEGVLVRVRLGLLPGARRRHYAAAASATRANPRASR